MTQHSHDLPTSTIREGDRVTWTSFDGTHKTGTVYLVTDLGYHCINAGGERCIVSTVKKVK